jgi:hypothetical protein
VRSVEAAVGAGEAADSASKLLRVLMGLLRPAVLLMVYRWVLIPRVTRLLWVRVVLLGRYGLLVLEWLLRQI